MIKNLSELIIQSEGLRLTAYRCPAGIPTIGVGHTANVKMGQVITQQQALDFLASDIENARSQIAKCVKRKLSDNQMDALIDFVFNLGIAKFQRSQLLKVINAGLFNEVPTQLKRWVYSGNTVLPGLVTRRNREAQVWTSGWPLES